MFSLLVHKHFYCLYRSTKCALNAANFFYATIKTIGLGLYKLFIFCDAAAEKLHSIRPEVEAYFWASKLSALNMRSTMWATTAPSALAT